LSLAQDSVGVIGGEILEYVIFALLLWFFIARSQKKKLKKAGKTLTRSIAQEQARYDKYMNSLPTLKGDDSYSQEVRGEFAYKEMLDNFGGWLKDKHPGKDEIWVIVETEPNNIHDPNAVRIETGQETVGYIPREEALEFAKELKQFGGRARCSARFYWDEFGNKSSLTLDVVRPLRQDNLVL
jgi:hypothetical protein